MSIESFRVRRKFQWSGFVYAKPGRCQCSLNPGSEKVSRQQVMTGDSAGLRTVEAMMDKNPCADLNHCNGITGTECKCGDAGYCTCSIKPWMYGGDVWLVNEGDPKKIWILNRRFVIYESGLPTGDELLEGKDKELYKTLLYGEPVPDTILFKPQGERIVSPMIKGLDNDEVKQVVTAEAETPVNPLIAKLQEVTAGKDN